MTTQQVPPLTLIRVQEAAQLLGISTRTLRRMTAAGIVKCIRVSPSSVRYSKESLYEYLRKGGAA